MDTEGYKRLQKEELNLDGMLNLRAAVVERACKDWCMAYLKGGSKNWEREMIENFFHSDLFKLYCDYEDPDRILRQLEQNCKDGIFLFSME